MPYRRLPNTDRARIRAIKTLIEKSDLYSIHELPVSMKVLSDVRSFLLKFEAAYSYYAKCHARQSKYAVKYIADMKTARLFISHFIQVLDLAIIRSEIKASCRSLYGLPINKSLPDLMSEGVLIKYELSHKTAITISSSSEYSPMG